MGFDHSMCRPRPSSVTLPSGGFEAQGYSPPPRPVLHITAVLSTSSWSSLPPPGLLCLLWVFSSSSSHSPPPPPSPCALHPVAVLSISSSCSPPPPPPPSVLHPNLIHWEWIHSAFVRVNTLVVGLDWEWVGLGVLEVGSCSSMCVLGCRRAGYGCGRSIAVGCIVFVGPYYRHGHIHAVGLYHRCWVVTLVVNPHLHCEPPPPPITNLHPSPSRCESPPSSS